MDGCCEFRKLSSGNREVCPDRYSRERAWMMFEPTYGSDDSLDDEIGVVSGIAREVGSDRLHIIEGLRRPDDSSHRIKRRLTSL